MAKSLGSRGRSVSTPKKLGVARGRNTKRINLKKRRAQSGNKKR